jgi:GntR family transcriptional regulator of gluconate operon
LMARVVTIRQEALGDRVAHDLRRRIVAGQVPVGTHLVEDALAEEYDVSRGPIRDALRRLVGEGLVESRRKGMYVTGLTEADVDELYLLREALETLAVRIAMANAGASGWRGAEACLDEMRAAAERGDVQRFAEADLEFHSQIYILAGNSRLRAVWEQYRPTFSAVLDVTARYDRDLRDSADDHAGLLEVLRGSDVDAALSRLRYHLAGSRTRLRAELRAKTSATRSG